jgi:hypothetical protein
VSVARFVTVLGLAGCLSILPAPPSTGIVKGDLRSCNPAECDGGFDCDGLGFCNTMCFEDEDCREGWKCCRSEDVEDTWETGKDGICPDALACYRP